MHPNPTPCMCNPVPHELYGKVDNLQVFVFISKWREFDPDTAYVVCISVSLGFPYVVSKSLCIPGMVVLQTFKRNCHFFWMQRYYGLLWTPHCPSAGYCDGTLPWPLLFHGKRADLSGTPINALAMQIHGDYGLSIDRLFV